MRLTDIITESELDEYDLNKASASNNNTRERPQNILGRIKTGLNTFHPFNSNIRNKAQGIQQIATQANELMANYQQWMGRTNQETPTKQNLIKWMTQQRLPLTGEVEELLNVIKAPDPKTPPTTPTPPQTPPVTTTAPTGTSQTTTPTPPVSEAEAEQPIPITNQQASEIISTAVGMMNSGDVIKTKNKATGLGRSRGMSGGSRSTASSETGSSIDIPTVVDFYKKLDEPGKDELKKQMQDVDTAPKPSEEPEPKVAEGHSRFLGMKL
jgi:hypothetical protein